MKTGTGIKLLIVTAVLSIWAAQMASLYGIAGLAPPAEVAPEILGRTLGITDAMLLAIVNWAFGSSAGSERKTELMGGK